LKKLESLRQELDQLPPDAEYGSLVLEGLLDSRVAAWGQFENALAFMKSELERIGKLKATRELTEDELRHEREMMTSLLDSMQSMLRRHFGLFRCPDDGR
jgi:hypothetical protein